MKFKSAKYTGCFQQLNPPDKFRGDPPLRRSASVIIPFGGGMDYLKRLSNCLRSVRWQQQVNHRNVEVILVHLYKASAGQEEAQQFATLAGQNNLLIVEAKKDYESFPLCLARNMGARVAQNETLVFVDADTVMDPEFLGRCLRQRGKLVTCWFSYLGEGHPPITGAGCVRKLAPEGKIVRAAYGGGIVAPREAVMKIRGFDEVYDRAWGADDNDMVDRLIEHGLEWYNMTMLERVVNLHQFHPGAANEKNPGTVANRKRYYNLQTVVRNEDGWGKP